MKYLVVWQTRMQPANEPRSSITVFLSYLLN